MRAIFACIVSAILLVGLSVPVSAAMAGNHVAHCKGSEEDPRHALWEQPFASLRAQTRRSISGWKASRGSP